MALTGPCMCGALDCESCGPAQGNHKCWVCGAWTFDGGCANPDACNAANERAEQAYQDEQAEAAYQESQYEHHADAEYDAAEIPF